MTEKILLVEDDPLLAASLQDLITSLGYQSSGLADSFDTAMEFAPSSEIAFVDVNLRDGATGPKIAERLANDYGISVVMLTGNPEAIKTALPRVVGLISKPIYPQMIKEALMYIATLRAGKMGEPPKGMKLFLK